MIKHNLKYDLEKIRKEVDWITSQYPDMDQVLLQSPKGDDWTTLDAPYKIHPDLRAEDFCISNTPDDFEITKFMIDTKIFRTRLLKLHQCQCYTWHKDYGTRVHLAVHTNEQCFFIENNIAHNIPEDGYPYEVDVSGYHTAINASSYSFTRIHLVGCLR